MLSKDQKPGMEKVRQALEAAKSWLDGWAEVGSAKPAYDLVCECLNSLPSAQPVEVERYYLASFKRKSLDGCVTWWGPNSAGYTTDLETAGTYTADECLSICKDGTEAYTVPVPVSFICSLRVRRSVDPGDTLNRPFWSADALRSSLRAAGINITVKGKKG